MVTALPQRSGLRCRSEVSEIRAGQLLLLNRKNMIEML